MAKILLIDSNRASRQMLEQAIMEYDHEVVSTHQGEEGLSLAVNGSPDLIVMDVDAKGLSGWQTIKILKESSATWLIPVIAMASPTVTGQRLLQSGFDTYERKPVSTRFVLKKIDILLDKVSPPQTKPAPPLSFSTMGEPQGARQLNHSTVVYVDDNLSDNQAMGAIVQGAGYSYANISDTFQVLPQLLERNPKLIFLELELPVANGYEICAQIRRLPTFQETPIIIVTNNDRIADRLRAKMVGASGFVRKPIRAKAILKVLIQHLSQAS